MTNTISINNNNGSIGLDLSNFDTRFLLDEQSSTNLLAYLYQYSTLHSLPTQLFNDELEYEIYDIIPSHFIGFYSELSDDTLNNLIYVLIESILTSHHSLKQYIQVPTV